MHPPHVPPAAVGKSDTPPTLAAEKKGPPVASGSCIHSRGTIPHTPARHQSQKQGWLTKRLAALFGTKVVAPTSGPPRQTQPGDPRGDGASHSLSIPGTSTTLPNDQNTAPGTLGTAPSTQPRRQLSIDTPNTTAPRPSPAQPDQNLASGVEDAETSDSNRFLDASSVVQESALPHPSHPSLDLEQSTDWFYTVGRLVNIDSLSSSAATDPVSSPFPPPHLFLAQAPDMQTLARLLPPDIVVDTCAFIARFGTAHVYTEPSDADFLSQYSPHVNAWSSRYDLATGARLDPTRDLVSWTVAKFGQHRKLVSWAAMEALRYWPLTRHAPVVPMGALQSGYRTLLAAEPGRVAESLVEHLKLAVYGQPDLGRWAIFRHVMCHARKEATKHPTLVEWMAKDWGSALAQVEDRGQWKSERDMASWMEGALMPVIAVVLTSKAPLP